MRWEPFLKTESSDEGPETPRKVAKDFLRGYVQLNLTIDGITMIHQAAGYGWHLHIGGIAEDTEGQQHTLGREQIAVTRVRGVPALWFLRYRSLLLRSAARKASSPKMRPVASLARPCSTISQEAERADFVTIRADVNRRITGRPSGRPSAPPSCRSTRNYATCGRSITLAASFCRCCKTS